MERIGLAASKIAKGNLLLYNIYVVLISSLFSLLIFVLSGTTVTLALILIAYVGNEVMKFEFEKNWSPIIATCMAALTVIMALFNIVAISKNIKLPKSRD